MVNLNNKRFIGTHMTFEQGNSHGARIFANVLEYVGADPKKHELGKDLVIDGILLSLRDGRKFEISELDITPDWSTCTICHKIENVLDGIDLYIHGIIGMPKTFNNGNIGVIITSNKAEDINFFETCIHVKSSFVDLPFEG